MLLWDPPQQCLWDAWMCEEFSSPIPVSRLLGCSGFGNAVGWAEDDASSNIQEIMSLSGCLMWNHAAVCGGRVRLEFLWGSGWICENHLRGIPQWCFLLPWCVVSIGMYSYWKWFLWAIRIRHCVILHSLCQSMPCASRRVWWICLWIPKCVSHVSVLG